MVSADWIEHRRLDGERLGWMDPVGDEFVVIDLLGRERTGPLPWFEAEEALEGVGLGYLAEPYALTLGSGEVVPVRIVEATVDGITLKLEDNGAIGGPREVFTVEFPAPPRLRLR